MSVLVGAIAVAAVVATGQLIYGDMLRDADQ
mgnify:FL=1